MQENAKTRLHDLDALRAVAMLLGIVLHSALAYSIGLWPVQDSSQSDGLGFSVAAIHGFRMALFFLLSGFFTAMLWRKRGRQALLKQRIQRVFLPLVLGLLTIIPALHWVSNWAMESAKRERAAQQQKNPEPALLTAIRKKDSAAVQRLLNAGENPNESDKEFKVIPLGWSSMYGNAEITRLLLEKGADIQGKNGDGSSPLHNAVFIGSPEVVKLLLEKGANPQAKDDAGRIPFNNTSVDWGITQYIVELLRIPLRPQEEITKGRKACVALLSPNASAQDNKGNSAGLNDLFGLRPAYKRLLIWSGWSLPLGNPKAPFNLVFTPFFDHLWFLWFLCWLVPFFLLWARAAEKRGWKGVPQKWVISPLAYLWLIPLTLIPQSFMGVLGPSFGPDTSIGLVPQPHILLYYGIFFAYGVLYYECEDSEGRLGKYWSMSLPLAVFGVLIASFITMQNPLLSGLFQVIYAWMMCFAMIGLFRRFLKRENKAMRYLSDASYWLYITHVPLVMLVQYWVKPWQIPVLLKFGFVCTSVTAVLLLCYAGFVRYTWLGTLLNGKRERQSRS